MRTLEEVTIRLEQVFTDPARALGLLKSLHQDGRVRVNIVRARIDPGVAELALELRGRSPRLQEVANLLEAAAQTQRPRRTPASRAS